MHLDDVWKGIDANNKNNPMNKMKIFKLNFVRQKKNYIL